MSGRGCTACAAATQAANWGGSGRLLLLLLVGPVCKGDFLALPLTSRLAPIGGRLLLLLLLVGPVCSRVCCSTSGPVCSRVCSSTFGCSWRQRLGLLRQMLYLMLLLAGCAQWAGGAL